MCDNGTRRLKCVTVQPDVDLYDAYQKNHDIAEHVCTVHDRPVQRQTVLRKREHRGEQRRIDEQSKRDRISLSDCCCCR